VRIALDGMGGDLGPRMVVEGTIRALARDRSLEVLLVGDEKILKREVQAAGLSDSRLKIVHASEMVLMSDGLRQVRGKRDSSIARAVELVRDGEADGVVGVGNTLAVVAITQFRLRLLEGIRRAGIAVPMPTGREHPCVLIDVGANVNAKPEHLAGYGLMASVYCEKILGRGNPRVGLLNVGEEEDKGSETAKETFDRFRHLPVRFAGNVEPHDIFRGAVDVAVCDGFAGNLVLKTAEAVAEMIFLMFRRELRRGVIRSLGGLLSKAAFREMRSRIDYAEYGGALLLGVNGVCVIGHGRSDGRAVDNAIRVAANAAAAGINERIVGSLAAES